MASIDEIRNTRIEKLQKLNNAGMDCYPAHTDRDFEIAQAIEKFEKLSTKEPKKEYSLAGRIMSLRPQGGLAFFHFSDGTGRFQALLKKGELISDADFDLFINTVDIGDFVEVTGTFFETNRKERTIQVKTWKMLAKTLRSLPEKWHGLTDTEERFRKRYLDTLMNAEVMQRFLTRTKIIKSIRSFYDDAGYIEVEVPTLQILAGGATAEPFVTHHNALDLNFYLTIAQELYLKELLAGGFTKVYEIGKRFRNEGIDTSHNPEFTMLESNEAYADAKSQRTFVEKLFKSVIKDVFESHSFTYDDQTIDVNGAFSIVTFYDLLRKFALIANPESLGRDEASIIAQRLGIKVDPKEAIEKILDNIYKKAARPKLIQPTFIIDYPVSFNPFAKRLPNDPTLIDRFQLVIGGVELVNAFSELNNPIDQKERYLEQDKKRNEGEQEISPSDVEYLEAMEHGMPPNGGIGIGIDRLVMLLTNVKNIKEVILFPTLKPRSE